MGLFLNVEDWWRKILFSFHSQEIGEVCHFPTNDDIKQRIKVVFIDHLLQSFTAEAIIMCPKCFKYVLSDISKHCYRRPKRRCLFTQIRPGVRQPTRCHFCHESRAFVLIQVIYNGRYISYDRLHNMFMVNNFLTGHVKNTKA